MTELLLIRHAVNDFVKTGKLAGWTPEVHLNEEGRAQAEALGLRLANTQIDAIYSSPLERTVETAQAVIAHHPGLEIQLVDDLGEVRYGDWQGQELRKLSTRKMWATIQFNPSRARFPNGEAMRDTQLRAVNALERLVEKHPRQTIAVVSHSDVIKMILAHYLGLHLDLFQRLNISPASLTIIHLSAMHTMIGQMNETSYLPQLKSGEEKSLKAILVGSVGEPGSRVFYLQAQRNDDSAVTVIFEKTQAMIIAEEVDKLFADTTVDTGDMAEIATLKTPDNPTFRAGKLALKYNDEMDQVCLEISEIQGNGVLRWWGTQQQMIALAESARRAVRGGLVTEGGQ